MDYIGKQFHNPHGVGGRVATLIMNIQNRGQYQAAETALSLKDGDKALDIGFGNGYLLRRLAGAYPCAFWGVDPSRDMLRAASKRNQKYIRQGRMTLLSGNAEQTGLPDDFFDKIYTVNTVYFWPSLDAGLREIRRILKPDGIFVNAVYSKEALDRLPVTRHGYRKYDVKELESAGNADGFSVEVKEIKRRSAYCIIYKKTEGWRS
ncbi:MAG: class I SAM-dependent methyltransferase [Oscillospiraceae bacterium]|nr:class I SAM-dependent methyltransferase [Oscillospiraceae bacterium]